MKLAIIGAGYVGLVTAACLARKGHDVVCVDIAQAKVDAINRGVSPIHEAGLSQLLNECVPDRLRASTDLRASVLWADVTFIAVGTPFVGDGIDLSYVVEGARQIGTALRDKSSYHVIVVKSTVVPGTTDGIVRRTIEDASGKRAGADFGLGMNPEFLTEGVAVRDFMFPDRLVLGGLDLQSLDALEVVYAPFVGFARVRTNCKTAEMIKYTSNALLATLISFSNEMARVCTGVGDVDIVDVMNAIHSNHYLSVVGADGGRIAAPIASFLEAGCGFGGSCLPKDVKALIGHGRQIGLKMSLLDAVVQVNVHQHQEVMALLKKHFQSLEGVRVTVLGLAFKPDTDDTRESPAIPIIRELLRERARVTAYDPAVTVLTSELLDTQIVSCRSLNEAMHNAEAVVLVTRWDEFKDVPALLAALGHKPVVIDGRRLLDKKSVANYEGIGLSSTVTLGAL